MDPSTPLIPLPQRQATMLPSEVQAINPDGFANVLAGPTNAAGLPRSQAEVDGAERAVASDGAVTAARAGQLAGRSSSVGAMQQRGRTHVAQTQARIRAGAKPMDPNAEPTALAPGPVAPQAAAPVDPGRPIDPDAPVSRPVYN
ncbi:MAG: hypothetical protein AAF580_07670 [Pseudomonadota bacterium]